MDVLQDLVEPYDQHGNKCPHALNALRWVSSTSILCAHCGRAFTLAPYEAERGS